MSDPHFDHLDPRNTMMSLMVLPILCDADTNAMKSHDGNTNASQSCDVNVDVNGITWQNQLGYISFELS